jgi:hypothetical protein
MNNLSPSAQAVMSAYVSSPIKNGDRPAVAAVLRAAVKQLATYAGVQDGYQRHLIDADEILSIAAELEAQ